MPKLKPLSNVDVNKACPDVYVYSNVISTFVNGNNLLKSTIKLVDDENLWIKNQKLLDSLYVFFYVNDNLIYKKSLNTFKKNIHENELYDVVEHEFNQDNLSIKYFCGNDNNISGDIFTEDILQNNTLLQSSHRNKKFLYINKNKDLRILNTGNFFEFKVEEKYEKKPIFNKCYISYNKSKLANLGYIFDLESFLYNNSKSYRFLSANPRMSKEVLNNSRIVQNNTIFYKKNISFENYEYEKIESKVSIRKFSSDASKQKYLISVTDLKNTNDVFSTFKIKLSGEVIDASQYLLKQKFINNFDIIKAFIEKYINEFNKVKLNKEVKDYRKEFLENNYKQYFVGTNRNQQNEIVQTVDILSEMYSFSTGVAIERYQSLFTSLLHPLTYEEGLLEKVILEVEKLQKYYRNLFYQVTLNENGDEIQVKNQNLDFSIELEDRLDYNYDPKYGFDVITQESYNYNTPESYFGLKAISLDNKNLRKSTEFAKYSSATGNNNSQIIKYLTISSMLLGDINHYFLNIQNTLPALTYNEILAQINSFNSGAGNYDFIETLYVQLVEKNVYIKTIGHGKNNSKSSLFKDLIFDRNKNSKEESKNIIYSLGIDDVYNLTIYNKYNNATEFFKTYFSNNNPLNPIKNYSIQDSKKNTIAVTTVEGAPQETNSARILLYNNFFEDKLLEDGDICSMFYLQPALVNDIFMKKLRFFNQYYVVEKIKQPVQQETIKEYLFASELKNYNITPINLDRNMQKYNINDMLSEI